jgi:undecaprenyl-diphosphatase
VSDLLKALVLGVVQGLTEFLPVSSTGHLVVFEEALNVDEARFGLAFDAAIHLGTLAAVVVYFRATFLALVRGAFRSLAARRWDVTAESRLAWLLVAGTVPAGIAGLLLEGVIEDAFRRPALVGAMLVVFSGALVLAERLRWREGAVGDIRFADTLVVGLAQAVALVPGVSRSGITISAGMLRGLRREEAARFAFLLSGPVIALAGADQLARIIAGSAAAGDSRLDVFLAGGAAAAVVGFAAVAFLSHFLRANSLYPFVAYRLAAGALVIALVVAGVL